MVRAEIYADQHPGDYSTAVLGQCDKDQQQQHPTSVMDSSVQTTACIFVLLGQY